MVDKALVTAPREQKVWLLLEPRGQAFLRVSADTAFVRPCPLLVMRGPAQLPDQRGFQHFSSEASIEGKRSFLEENHHLRSAILPSVKTF